MFELQKSSNKVSVVSKEHHEGLRGEAGPAVAWFHHSQTPLVGLVLTREDFYAPFEAKLWDQV